MFVRAWRFVRVGHGLYASVHELEHLHMEEHLHHLEKYIEELERRKDGMRGGSITNVHEPSTYHAAVQAHSHS